VALLREVPAGTAVSYGGTWVARRRSRIGTVPLGYADGIPRTSAMSGEGRFVVRGRSVPLAGRVCMDLTMLDLTDHEAAGEGEEAVLFGDEPDAWEVAGRADTIAYAVLTSIGPRLPRVYVEKGRTVAVSAPLLPAL
jgi:alanine racemase